eukprot:498661-Pyramimonas_sp.AAC.1
MVAMVEEQDQENKQLKISSQGGIQANVETSRFLMLKEQELEAMRVQMQALKDQHAKDLKEADEENGRMMSKRMVDLSRRRDKEAETETEEKLQRAVEECEKRMTEAHEMQLEMDRSAQAGELARMVMRIEEANRKQREEDNI